MKILIVEDETTVSRILRILLEKRGHDVVICSGIEEGPLNPTALAALDFDLEPFVLNLSHFDLAFLDGNLVGPVLGTVLVEPLSQFGAVVIATSANLDLQKAFALLGVDYACEKSGLAEFLKTRLDEAIALRQSRLAKI